MLVFPNAKINIGLNVTSKRTDGFHEIESIFYPLPIKDALEAIPSDQLKFECEGASLSQHFSENTILKAYEVLTQYREIKPVHFYLLKNIPQEAGLGGGSADGTFALKLLNHLQNLDLNNEALETFSGLIGSDCPFFVANQPQIATGRGEKLEQVDLSLSGYSYVVVHPPFSISTQKAYQQIQPREPRHSLSQVIRKPVEAWEGFIKNDFEQYALEAFPAIKAIKQTLYRQGALYASLTGSGSAVYGIFEEIPDLASHFPENYQVLQGAF